MTTADAARELGVSSEFIRGEILARRLTANISNRDGKRAVYRITPAQLQAYVQAHWTGVPKFLPRGKLKQPAQ